MNAPRSLPGIRAVASYRREWLHRDLTAGIVLSTLLVPQGMAYAELAHLPAITGLYTTILCLLGYAVFGRVVEGMDVVDKIAGVKTENRGPMQNMPVLPVVIESARMAKTADPAPPAP